MAYDEKQFLDLLQEHKSDETKKARRNLSTISFVVVAAWLLKIRLVDIKVLGVDISRTAELPVLGLAGVLLLYWTVMFLLTWKHDKEIQRERTLLLDAQVKQFTERLAALEKQRDAQGADAKWVSSDHKDVKVAVMAYNEQQMRTRQASLFGALIKQLEFYVPLLLGGGAALVLTLGVIHAE